ncbi:MAG: LptE family protein [Proteobacteria bacterium]|nr:LptE family protein [Pseudomonadota bacterium]
MKTKRCFRSGVSFFLIIAFFFIFINGCGGYRFASDYNSIPDEIKSISIPFFKNETFEANIESYFTTALINEFIKNKQIRVVTHRADATLFGSVKKFTTSSIAYSYEDRTLEYRAYVVLELSMKKNDTGKILWRKPRLVHDEEYRVETDIALTEADKKATIQKIAIELAEQIYEDLVLGF